MSSRSLVYAKQLGRLRYEYLDTCINFLSVSTDQWHSGTCSKPSSLSNYSLIRRWWMRAKVGSFWWHKTKSRTRTWIMRPKLRGMHTWRFQIGLFLAKGNPFTSSREKHGKLYYEKRQWLHISSRLPSNVQCVGHRLSWWKKATYIKDHLRFLLRYYRIMSCVLCWLTDVTLESGLSCSTEKKLFRRRYTMV